MERNLLRNMLKIEEKNKTLRIALDELPSSKKLELEEYSRFLVYNLLIIKVVDNPKVCQKIKCGKENLTLFFNKKNNQINPKKFFERIKNIVEKNEQSSFFLFSIKGIFSAIREKDISKAGITYTDSFISFETIFPGSILLHALKTHFFSPINTLQDTFGDYYIDKEGINVLTLKSNKKNAYYKNIMFIKYTNFKKMIKDYESGYLHYTCNTFFKYKEIKKYPQLNITSSRLKFYIKINYENKKELIKEFYNIDRIKVINEVGKGIKPSYSNIKNNNIRHNLNNMKKSKVKELKLSYFDYYPNKEICKNLEEQIKGKILLKKCNYFQPENMKKNELELIIIPNYGSDDFSFFYLEGIRIILNSKNQRKRKKYLELLLEFDKTHNKSLLKKMDLLVLSEGYVPLFDLKNLFLKKENVKFNMEW